jgi:hypothetical protein
MEDCNMKAGKLEQIRNRLDIPEKFFAVFLTISALWVAGCLLLLVPAVRSLIFGTAEFILRRSFSSLRDKCIRWSLECLAAYLLFFFVFFHKKIFTGANTGKNLYLFMVVIAAGVLFCVFYKVNWVFGDDIEYITTTAVNKYVPLKSAYSELGRFFPLGKFHYNIPLFLYRLFGGKSGFSAAFHFIIVALFYLITVFSLYVLFRRIEPFKDKKHAAFTVFFVCTWFLMAKAYPQIYMNSVYSETQIIMLFAVFMLMYYRALETDKKRYFIAAALSAVYASYCKEPVFGVFLIIVLINHIFRYRRESKNEKLFYASLVVNAALFLFLYYFFSFRNASGFYNSVRELEGGFRFIYPVFADNAFYIIMIPLCFIRLVYIFVRKDREHLYYDSLLFAGAGYGFAFVLLRLNYNWYFLPSVIFFLPSLVYWTKYLYQKKNGFAMALVLFLLLIYLFNINSQARRIKYLWKSREEFMPYIEDLYSEYESGKEFVWYESDDVAAYSRIYKITLDYRKDVLNIFLNYRNKSEGKDFFAVVNETKILNMKDNILFFYPLENNKYGPLLDAVKGNLDINGFVSYKHPDYNAVLIFRKP